MNHVLISPGLSQPHARMPVKAEQHSHIAGAYDKAAFDISFPAHTRAAFARKADWFRLLARVAEKKRARDATERCCKKTPGSTTGPILVLGPARQRAWSVVGRAKRYASEVISRGA